MRVEQNPQTQPSLALEVEVEVEEDGALSKSTPPCCKPPKPSPSAKVGRGERREPLKQQRATVANLAPHPSSGHSAHSEAMVLQITVAQEAVDKWATQGEPHRGQVQQGQQEHQQDRLLRVCPAAQEVEVEVVWLRLARQAQEAAREEGPTG